MSEWPEIRRKLAEHERNAREFEGPRFKRGPQLTVLLILVLVIARLVFAQGGTVPHGKWDPPTGDLTGFVGYRVYRGPAPNEMNVLFSQIPLNSFTDTTAQQGQTYYYKVTALYQDGEESGPTNIAVVMIPSGGGC